MPSENEPNNSEDTVSRLEPVLPNGDKISWKESPTTPASPAEQKKNKEAPVKESNIAELTCDMSEAEIDAALMATFGVVCDEE